MSYTLRPYQTEAVAGAFEQWKENGSTLLVLATGCGKCLGRGTPVLMFDGSVKDVQEVVPGDELMGPDSKSRRVISTTFGIGELYRVNPMKGDSYIVNDAHILSLRKTGTNEVKNVSVLEFLGENKNFRHLHKGWRTGVEFPDPERDFTDLPPYILGLWLGDGTSHCFHISKPDPEIAASVKEYAESIGMTYGFHQSPGKCPTHKITSVNGQGRWPNAALQALDKYFLRNNKHIPFAYKTSSRKDRLELLAGLMDSDGSVANGGFDFISIDSGMAVDLCFVARSVGLAAYLKPCVKSCQTGAKGNYFRVSISGDCSIIPTRIPRKKAHRRQQKKNVLNVGLTAESIGDGEYFGFEIDGDGLFLLGDFTVTHNTTIFSEIIRRFLPMRSIVIAHREELIFQAQERIASHAHIDVQVEMGDMRASTDLLRGAECVVATVQTISRRLDSFDPMQYGLLVIDESHRGVAASYLKTIEHFKKNPDLRILGVTATPDRADEEALGQVFDTVAYEYDILQAIEGGWLVPIDQQMVHIASLDYSQVKITCGDLNGGDLAKVMEQEENLQGICSSGIELLGERQAIMFASSVLHAEKACEIFNRHRPGMAIFACGTTEKETRRAMIKAFKENRHQVFCNVGLATEGADFPNVSAILMARPTQSRSLYAQCLGRALRTLPGLVDPFTTAEERREAILHSSKPAALCIDYVGNSGKHKLVTTADILGGNVSDEILERAKDIANKSKGSVRMVEVIAEAEEKIREEREARRLADEARRNRVVAKASYTTSKVNPFDVFAISPVRERGWDKDKVLSEKQIALLAKQGIDGHSMPYGQAKQLLNELFKRWNAKTATFKQLTLLRKHGVDGSKMSMKDASLLIDRIASNGWRFKPEMMPQ